MRSHEALQKAIAGKTVKHAKRLGLSSNMLNRWQEPTADWSDSGAYNPLDRLEAIIELSHQDGNPDCYAPIDYLAQKFSGVFIPLPPHGVSPQELTNALLSTVKEFSHLAQAASDAMKDGHVARHEMERISNEGYHLIRQTLMFIDKAKECTK